MESYFVKVNKTIYVCECGSVLFHDDGEDPTILYCDKCNKEFNTRKHFK